ncbi:MAG: UbiD family decarboxylase [Candidatus Binatia bacterium]|jgi:UbiD family decarboxylase|nr:UbiD family decarboxylase [Candidatus Binatia bacterium]
MPYADLREFLYRLEKEGELAHVSNPVDLHYEIGAVCRKTLDLSGPALSFGNIRGHNIPLVVNLFATRRRYAMAIDTTPEKLHAHWTEHIQKPVQPIWVKSGPCKENIIIGKDADLMKFPIPIWNEFDGGPFITLPCHISKHPVTGARNAAMYRGQVHDSKTIGILAAPYRHIVLHRNEALKRGESLPVAIALGVDPSISIASVASFPYEVDELAMAGALRGAPVELVPCETIPLEVPVTSEIVIEGEIDPHENVEEGLFGEFSGYYGVKVPRPVIKVKAITYRNEPIYAASYEGLPPHDTVLLTAVPIETEILTMIHLPGIQKVHVTDGGCGAFNCIISVKKDFEGYGKMVGMAALTTWGARYVKTLIVVDDDIDPYNWTEVEWALATRVQPHRDVEILKDLVGCILDPSLSLDERKTGHSRTSKMIIDATKYDAHEFETPCRPKPDVMERVNQQWSEYAIPIAHRKNI